MSLGVLPYSFPETYKFTKFERFTSSGTWSHPDGYAVPRTIIVLAVGGGGGGGAGGLIYEAAGDTDTNAYVLAGGGGGGSGGIQLAYINNFSQLTITIGSGGIGGITSSSVAGTYNGQDGTAGGNTIISESELDIVAVGGGGGGQGGSTAKSLVDFNFTTRGVGGAAGFNGGLAGGNAAGSGSLRSSDSSSISSATQGGTPYAPFTLAYTAEGSSKSFIIPDLASTNHSSPIPGPGGGTARDRVTSTNFQQANGAGRHGPFGIDIYRNTIGPGNSGNSRIVTSVGDTTTITGFSGGISYGYGCGGGGGGSFYRSPLISGDPTIESGRGGNGGDGVVYIFY